PPASAAGYGLRPARYSAIYTLNSYSRTVTMSSIHSKRSPLSVLTTVAPSEWLNVPHLPAEEFLAPIPEQSLEEWVYVRDFARFGIHDQHAVFRRLEQPTVTGLCDALTVGYILEREQDPSNPAFLLDPARVQQYCPATNPL